MCCTSPSSLFITEREVLGILGTPFLGSAYTVFDLENHALGIAQANPNPGDPVRECINRQGGLTLATTANMSAEFDQAKSGNLTETTVPYYYY